MSAYFQEQNFYEAYHDDYLNSVYERKMEQARSDMLTAVKRFVHPEDVETVAACIAYSYMQELPEASNLLSSMGMGELECEAIFRNLNKFRSLCEESPE